MFWILKCDEPNETQKEGGWSYKKWEIDMIFKQKIIYYDYNNLKISRNQFKWSFESKQLLKWFMISI